MWQDISSKKLYGDIIEDIMDVSRLACHMGAKQAEYAATYTAINNNYNMPPKMGYLDLNLSKPQSFLLEISRKSDNTVILTGYPQANFLRESIFISGIALEEHKYLPEQIDLLPSIRTMVGKKMGMNFDYCPTTDKEYREAQQDIYDRVGNVYLMHMRETDLLRPDMADLKLKAPILIDQYNQHQIIPSQTRTDNPNPTFGWTTTDKDTNPKVWCGAGGFNLRTGITTTNNTTIQI